jgi:Bacterial SH3 domain
MSTRRLTAVTAAGAALVAALMMAAPARAQGQPQRGGQGQAVQADPNAKVLARVRVPTSHANIHSGPNTGNEVLVLAPKGTELEMIGRRGEWIQVRLPQALRKTGILMRWYKNETSGWMHDSTVEFLTPEAKPDAK